MKISLNFLSFLGLAICFNFSSCNTTDYILETDWSTSSIGSSPVKDIPNGPIGDLIVYDNNYDYKSKIINIPSFEGVNEYKALEYNDRLDNDSYSSHRSDAIGFKAVSTNWFNDIKFSWNGNSTNLKSDLIFGFSTDLNKWEITRMEIKKNGYIYIQSVPFSYNCDRIIGRIHDISKLHQISLTLHARTNTYDILIFGGGVQSLIDPENESFGSISISGLTTNFDLLKEEGEKKNWPRLYMWSLWNDSNHGSKYIFNNLNIKKL